MNLILTLVLAAQIVGSESVYTARSKDSLKTVGARFGVSVTVLAQENRLKPTDHLHIGQTLKIDNRHIVPLVDAARIVVNIPQRTLFWTDSSNTVHAFPIAAGKPSWRTPTGTFEVASHETNPVWDVPVSIQEEMRNAGKPVLTRVPPGPENPLGKHWIGLSIPGVGIHGTNAPSGIYRLATHGCIRLHPDDIQQMFPQVEIGMTGEIIYQAVLVTRVGDSVYVEVHPDAYGRGSDSLATVLELARVGGYDDMLDLSLAREVFRKRDGVARDVTRR